MASAAENITRHYGGDWHGTYGTLPTPGHSKRDRGTKVEDGEAGDVVFHSFNGGDWRDLKDECRRIGLLPAKEAAPRWRETGHYEYCDANGAAIYRTVRLEHPTQPKQFRAQRPDGRGGWTNKLGDVERVPYRLPELLAADPAEPVYFVEGEKKADKLASWGMVATAIAFGAKGWRHEYAAHLVGRTVIILPDNDEPGREFAEKVRAALDGVAARVVVLELPGLAPKGDIINWTGSADDLRVLADAALSALATDGVELLPMLDAADFDGVEVPDREWMLEGWEPRYTCVFLTGAGATGKSLLTQQRLTCSAVGMPFLGVSVRQGVSVYITCEDDTKELHRRQSAINAALGITWKDLRGKLKLVSLKGMLNKELCTFDQEGRMRPSERWRSLVATIESIGATHVALDNVAHFFTGNENIRNQVAAFAGMLDGFAEAIGGVVLLLGHPNKVGDEYSGSTAWENQVRARLYLGADKGTDGVVNDPDARVLTNSKPNYSRRGEALNFIWYKWAFVRLEDLPANMAQEYELIAATNAGNEAFLRCLERATADQRAVSHNPGSNYAPKIFARMPAGKGTSEKAFAAAMERLIGLGHILLDQPLWRGPNRVMKQGITVSETAPTPLHRPPAPTCTKPAEILHASTPLDTTYQSGAAHVAAAPSHEENEGGRQPIDFSAFGRPRANGAMILAPGETGDDVEF